MIHVAYDEIDYTPDYDRVRAMPNGGGPQWRFHASAFLPQCLMDFDRFRVEQSARLVADGRPFIYPLELTGRMAVKLTSGSPDFAPGLPDEVIKSIQGGRAALVIFIIEPTALEFVPGSRWVFDHIQEMIDQKQLPASRVWFISGRVTGVESFAAWLAARGYFEAEVFRFRAVAMLPSWFRALYRAAAQGWDVEYDVEYAEDESATWASTVTRRPCPPSVFRQRWVAPEQLSSEWDEDVTRPKRFLCMNGKPHHHRQLIVAYLHGRGYAEQSLVSFPDAPVDLNDTCASPVMADFLRESWLRLQPNLPLSIDAGPPPNLVSVPMKFARVEHNWPYRQSYFNITTETTFFPGYPPHISEKLLKPALGLQPFICVSVAHTLRYWRAIGFKTFSRVIDESYDEDVDPAIRLARVFQTVDRLAALTPREARELFFECRPELEHNRAHFIEGPHQLDLVFDELEAQVGST
ncbi:MAG TPA: hypothetical protein VMB81_16290 [Candidatus Sulfotelmatobacter sp.]|nr:hypothetical protein [Candidatus Sulfotelmatobacter sp.]